MKSWSSNGTPRTSRCCHAAPSTCRCPCPCCPCLSLSLSSPLAKLSKSMGSIFVWASAHLGFHETHGLAAHHCVARAFLRVEKQLCAKFQWTHLLQTAHEVVVRKLSSIISCHLDLGDRCINTVHWSEISTFFSMFLGSTCDLEIVPPRALSHSFSTTTPTTPFIEAFTVKQLYVDCTQLCAELSHALKRHCAICACPFLLNFVVVESFQLVSCPCQTAFMIPANVCARVRNFLFISLRRYWFADAFDVQESARL